MNNLSYLISMQVEGAEMYKLFCEQFYFLINISFSSVCQSRELKKKCQKDMAEIKLNQMMFRSVEKL